MSESYLLFRFGAIGNALAAVPAIRALRRARPEAGLTLVADPLTIELLSTCPYIDEAIRYDNRGPERAGPGYARFIARLRRRRPTHAVHFRRFIRSELMGFLSGAPVRAGFGTDERLQFINRRVVYEEGANVVEQNLRLVRALGIDAGDRSLEYWPPADASRVDAILDGLPGAGPLVAVHPGGTTQSCRLWPYFGALAGRLRRELDARVVMVGAPAERELVEAAAAEDGLDARTAVGLGLPELGELIRRADLFAGTDSGPAHLADAVNTPGAIIYAPHHCLADQIEKWKPEGEDYLAFTPPRDCRDCEREHCTKEMERVCAADIPVDAVARGLIKLHEKTSGKSA